jgi:hypothetical protein
MHKALAVWVVVITLGSIFSARAESIGPSISRNKVINESNFAAAGYDGPYKHHQSCGYYRYVCRAWWTGCGWEGPYSFPLNRYWGYRYLCW